MNGEIGLFVFTARSKIVTVEKHLTVGGGVATLPVTQVMLLLPYLLLLAHITVGSSLPLPEDVCYGSTYRLPAHFTPVLYNQTITFTPKEGVPKIVVNHGQSLDSRFKVSRGKIEMANLSERDNDATLSIVKHIFDSVLLRVKNCRSIVKKLCGSSISWRIPYDAEYLEFSGPDVLAPPTVLWNRTSRSSIRGKVSGSDYEIKDITQQDSGYYRFRGSKDQLLKWEQIEVEAHVRSYDFDEGNIKLQYPIIFTPGQIKFKHTWASKAKPLSESDDRFKITNTYLAIDYATPEDAGTYDFLDKDGNLILHVTLEIREVEKVWVSVVVLAVISFGFILCCCCMKKYCCKESSDKTNCPESEADAAAPPVYHHGTQTTEPETPLLSREPRVIFSDPPTYNEADGHVDPPPPYEECDTQVSAPPVPTYSSEPHNTPAPAEPTVISPEPTNRDDIADGAVMVDVSPPDQVSTAEARETTGDITFTLNSFDLTTGSDPHFDLRGVTLPSAPPLSSDESNSAEYNSDKFNFL